VKTIDDVPNEVVETLETFLRAMAQMHPREDVVLALLYHGAAGVQVHCGTAQLRATLTEIQTLMGTTEKDSPQ
jgi:hypothetical protein